MVSATDCFTALMLLACLNIQAVCVCAVWRHKATHVFVSLMPLVVWLAFYAGYDTTGYDKHGFDKYG